MEILSITGVTKKENIRITQPFKRLLIIVEHATALPVGIGNISMYKEGQETNHRALKHNMFDEFEMSQLGEGAFYKDTVSVRGYFNLSDSGAVELDNDKAFVLGLTELNSACTYTIHLEQDVNIDPFMTVVKKQSIELGKQTLTVKSLGCETIAIPKDLVSKMTVHFEGGTEKYNEALIEAIGLNENDVVSVDSNGIPNASGFDRLIQWSLIGVKSIFFEFKDGHHGGYLYLIDTQEA